MTLTLADYMALIGVLGAVVGLPLKAMLSSLKTLRTDTAAWRAALDKRFGIVEARVDDLNRRFEEQMRAMDQAKVSKSEWIRHSGSQDRKLEAMSAMLATMSGKLDATIGLGGSMRRIAESVETMVEQSKS